MKNKIIGILLTVLIFAVPMGIAIFHGDGSSVPVPEKVVYTNVFTPVDGGGISGPSTATVGELVRLQVKGEQVKWSCLPKTEDIETFGEGSDKCVISFRANGSYTIIAAVLNKGIVTLETIQISVGGVAPGPNNPPGPITGPSKVDTVLAAQVRSWCVDSKVNKEQAKKLASTFNQVASEANAGQLNSTGEIINRTAQLNQSLSLSGFDGVMAKIQAYLTQQADAGVLSTPQQHVTVWFSIAAGLEQYGSEPSGSKR